MHISKKPVTMILIESIMESHHLDPVRVIFENLAVGRGRMIITCYDTAWVAFWGAMGERTVEQFILTCNPDYIVDNLTTSAHTNKFTQHAVYLTRIVVAIQTAIRAMQPKPNKAQIERQKRLQHANDLIKLISSRGRRFFWNESAQWLASLDIDQNGKIWWTDDYMGRRVMINKVCGYEHEWRGFSHGGTLKSLVQMMREYIQTGNGIPIWYIGQSHWGYSEEEAHKLRLEAKDMPIIRKTEAPRAPF